MSEDIVNDTFHLRHDSKWSGRLGPAEGGGLVLCVACVIEMIESDDISVRNMMNVFCRKSRLNPSPLIHFLWFIGDCYPCPLWLWATRTFMGRDEYPAVFPQCSCELYLSAVSPSPYRLWESLSPYLVLAGCWSVPREPWGSCSARTTEWACV